MGVAKQNILPGSTPFEISDNIFLFKLEYYYILILLLFYFRVGIEHTKGDGPNAYISATISKKIPDNTPELQEIPVVPADSDSDSSE